MDRNDGKKNVSFRIDIKLIDKFDKFISQFKGIAKQEVVEYFMDYCTELRPDEFLRSFKAYMTEKIDREIGRKMPDKKA